MYGRKHEKKVVSIAVPLQKLSFQPFAMFGFSYSFQIYLKFLAVFLYEILVGRLEQQ
jgi:hypothetical protein